MQNYKNKDFGECNVCLILLKIRYVQNKKLHFLDVRINKLCVAIRQQV
jgi:hypothetical protein